MNKITKLAFGLLIIIAALFIGITQSPNTSASVTPGEFVACPTAPAVAHNGWSLTLRSTFVKSSVSNKTMYCHYTSEIINSRPCAPGRACIAVDKGFDLGSAGGEIGE